MPSRVSFFEETSYGAYLGLRKLDDEKLSKGIRVLYSCPDFDVLEGGQVRAVVSRSSRFPGDDKAGVHGINYYRKRPNYEEALEYWKHLPHALVNTFYTGRLAFAARDLEDYTTKIDIYDRFQDYIFGTGTHNCLVLVAPHSGDISYPADSIKPHPRNDIDKWSGHLTLRLFERLHQRKIQPKKVFLHTSNDHIKSFPAIIDIGDMGNQLSDQFNLSIEQLQRFHEPDYRTQEESYILRIIKNSREVLRPKAQTTSRTTKSFYQVNSLKKLAQYNLSLEELMNKSVDELLSIFRGQKNFILANHMFTGRKVAKLLSPYPTDTALQLECSEFFLEACMNLMVDIIEKMLCFSENN